MIAHRVLSVFSLPSIRHARNWQPFDGFDLYHKVPAHVIEYQTTLWQSEVVRKVGTKRSLDLWPRELPGKNNLENMNDLFAREAGYYG